MRNLSVRFPTWAMWLCAAITLLAGVLLLFAIVLGVRAGQQQIEIKRRQQIGLALQRGIEYHSAGQLAAAQTAYEEVLILDSNNSAALDGLAHIRQLGILTTTGSLTTTVSTPLLQATAVLLPAETPLPANPTAVSVAEIDQVMQQAESAYAAGRWSESIALLQKIRQLSTTYEVARIDELLFTAYINLATEKDNQDKLEEALTLYDQALALQPDAIEISQERQLIAEYLDVVTYTGVSWERSAEMLRTLYNEEPDYRDIKERFHEALLAYSEERAAERAWCDSSELLTEAINIAVTPGIIAQRDTYQTTCDQVGNEPPPLDAASLGLTGTISTAVGLAPLGDDLPVAIGDPSGLLSRGRILYSATDVTTGRNRIMQQTVGSSSPATVVREDAAQPAMRQDGLRLVFRNTRNDMAGISAWDAGTDLSLQFTGYTEDSQPSWSADSNRVVFASNREGDRIWRIYTTWADGNSESVMLSIGESPDWHPFQDAIVFRGCDDSGNGCGLWTIDGAGGSRAPLTTVAADNRPAWSPDGRYVVFMSDGRDGNPEIYRIDTVTAQVLRLTNSPGLDGLPAVSPDGRSVAFISNRDGGWKLWAVPMGGGSETLIAPLSGNVDNWSNQGMQWIP